MLERILAAFAALPPGTLYALIAALAAVENVFPPVPSDVALALGALLAGRGVLDPWLVFAAGWAGNVGSATLVYRAGHRYGRPFFLGPLGRRLVSEAGLRHIETAYARHGGWGIFVSRLLPVWRAVVPPFAGVAGLPAGRALPPIALAALVWYGALTAGVTVLGTNLDAVLAVLTRVNAALLAIAGLAALTLGIVIWMKRR